MGKRRPFARLMLLPLVGLMLAGASCSSSKPTPPQVPHIDTEPVGDGLKVIGYAMLGGAIVVVLGKLLR